MQDDTSGDHQASSAVDIIHTGEMLLDIPPEMVHIDATKHDAQPEDVLSENSHDQTNDDIQESMPEGHESLADQESGRTTSTPSPQGIQLEVYLSRWFNTESKAELWRDANLSNHKWSDF